MTVRSGRRHFYPIWPNGVWPNAKQELLIKAALLDDADAARTAFRDWSKADDLFFVDNGLNLFLMLLYERIKRWGENYPDRDRLRGAVRHAWVMHQRFRRDIREIGSTFGSAGIEIMLLKGAALNVSIYPDANRLMSDIDIAVSRVHLLQAVQTLTREGWKPNFRNLALLPMVTHACQFYRGDSLLDLHWEFFHGRPVDPARLDAIWKSSRVAEIDGTRYRLLSPEYGLIHICEHGLRYNPTPPMRWLADAFFHLRHGGAIDWHALLTLSMHLGLSQHIGLTLKYLAIQLQQPEAINALQCVPSWDGSLLSRAELALQIRRMPGCHPFWRELPSHVPAFLRARRRFPGLRLANYVRAVNNFEGPLSPILRRLVRLQFLAAFEEVKTRCREILRRWRGDTTTFDLSLFQDTQWSGWFPPEDVPKGFLRWSQPNASILAPISSQHRTLALKVHDVRPLDASFIKSFRVRLNRMLIPNDSIQFDRNTIIIPLPIDALVEREEQRIELVCGPLFVSGDSRPLGIPVRSVTLQGDRP